MDQISFKEYVDDEMVIIQANIDDMNPEYCSYIADLLFAEGANDVYWIPIIMKKGRPGIMLNVLASNHLCFDMERIIFKETTTFGVRYMQTKCHRLGRKWVEVETPWGMISVKLGYHKGELVQYAPEFNECEQISKKYKIPLKYVYDYIRAAYLNQ